jgi:predicted transcriptional regulator
VDKGYLATDAAAQNFTLTQKGKDFLALDVKPEFEAASSEEAEAVE